MSCPGNTLAFGNRCIPSCGVARWSSPGFAPPHRLNIGKGYAPCSRLAGWASQPPRCSTYFRDRALGKPLTTEHMYSILGDVASKRDLSWWSEFKNPSRSSPFFLKEDFTHFAFAGEA